MTEEKKVVLRAGFKNNFKFYLLVFTLCLITWFGVKMITSYLNSSSRTVKSAEKSSSILQLGGDGVGVPPGGSGGLPPVTGQANK